MHVGRLTRLGTSLAVVVPVPTLRELGWFHSDLIEHRIENGYLMLRNVTQRSLKPKRKKGEYDDASTRSRVE